MTVGSQNCHDTWLVKYKNYSSCGFKSLHVDIILNNSPQYILNCEQFGL